MNNLFLCKTSYQVLVIVQLVLTRFQNDENDIWISDTIANQEVLYDRIRVAGIFRSVKKHPTKAYLRKSKGFYVLMGLLSNASITPNLAIDRAYDRFLFCNISYEETLIYRALKKKSKNMETYLFEDGFSSYTKNYGDFFASLHSGTGYRHMPCKIYKYLMYEAYYKIKAIYAFTPELFEWLPEHGIVEIKKIDPSDSDTIRIFNQVFGYEEVEDTYDENTIFFEESYYADGIEVGDYDLVNKIAAKVSENNLLVKLHPRNPANRFRNQGIHTNIGTHVPWEIIALNIDLKNKTLITIASGSALTSLINTSIKPKRVVMLMNSKEFQKSKLTPTLSLLQKIAGKHSDVVALPETVGQFLEML